MKVVAFLEPPQGDVIEEILHGHQSGADQRFASVPVGGLWPSSTPRAPPEPEDLARRARCRLLGQRNRSSRPIRRADLRRHRHVPGQLLIITDAHRHGDVAYQLRDRAVFCDLAGPKFTHHRQKTASVQRRPWPPLHLASLELAIVPSRVSSGAEIKNLDYKTGVDWGLVLLGVLVCFPFPPTEL